MKRITLVVIMLFSIFAVKAQDKNDSPVNLFHKKNEVKLNLLTPLFGSSSFEAIYERNLNKKAALGISVYTVFDAEDPDYDLNYSISPYYRMYFGQKYAAGFFAEGFGMVSSIDGKKVYQMDENLPPIEGPAVMDLSLGIGIGSKWVTRRGFVFEVNAGWGKQLFNYKKTDHDQVVKLGFNVGYQF